MRPLASSSRIVRSERITAGRLFAAGGSSGLGGAAGDPAVLLVGRLGGDPEGLADVGPGGALLPGLRDELGDECFGSVTETLGRLQALAHVAPGEVVEGGPDGGVGGEVDLHVASPDPLRDGALMPRFPVDHGTGAGLVRRGCTERPKRPERR